MLHPREVNLWSWLWVLLHCPAKIVTVSVVTGQAMIGELRGYADAASFGHWVAKKVLWIWDDAPTSTTLFCRSPAESDGRCKMMQGHGKGMAHSPPILLTLFPSKKWGGISRQGAKDALKNFLMTAQELDAQNATSRLSQVERFRSQVGIPQGKTAKNPKQAKQKITLHKIEREAIPMSRSVVSHKSATWIPGFQHLSCKASHQASTSFAILAAWFWGSNSAWLLANEQRGFVTGASGGTADQQWSAEAAEALCGARTRPGHLTFAKTFIAHTGHLSQLEKSRIISLEVERS